jgi:hypothetical protein
MGCIDRLNPQPEAEIGKYAFQQMVLAGTFAPFRTQNWMKHQIWEYSKITDLGLNFTKEPSKAQCN